MKFRLAIPWKGYEWLLLKLVVFEFLYVGAESKEKRLSSIFNINGWNKLSKISKRHKLVVCRVECALTHMVKSDFFTTSYVIRFPWCNSRLFSESSYEYYLSRHLNLLEEEIYGTCCLLQLSSKVNVVYFCYQCLILCDCKMSILYMFCGSMK